MADMLLPAEPGTKALRVRWDGNTACAEQHPLVGWVYVSGGMAHPVVAANITDARAVLFPSGEVTDRQMRQSFASLDAWLDEIHSLGPGREVVPHRSGGGETVETPVYVPAEVTEDPSPKDRPDSKSIADLGLSSRARNALESARIHVVRDFEDWFRSNAKNIRGVPANALPVIEAAMEAEGVRWREDGRPAETTEPSGDENNDLL